MRYNKGMRIYFSGIGGVGIGPLAMIAHDAGYDVTGSDRVESLITKELQDKGISYSLDQSGESLQQAHAQAPIDWFVYTAALPHDHPELTTARQLGIKTAKRDELLAHIIQDKNLKLIAIAGTHGKTTTTGMMVWALQQLGIPVSYSVGSNLSFGPSGKFDPASKLFVYECDEFDRNFLHFHPWVSLITSIDYDHPDTYPTQADYDNAFDQFIRQSEYCIMWQQDCGDLGVVKDANTLLHLIDKTNKATQTELEQLPLAGQHNRENAYLVLTELLRGNASKHAAIAVLSSFPGTGRRFEKLAENLYSDYGHHPIEIAATLQMARELSDNVVLVYQPHQNVRQHEVQHLYTDCFELASAVYWLPTYLTREDPNLPVLSPQELTANLTNRQAVQLSDLDDNLWEAIEQQRRSGALILCMGAGTIDSWLRDKLTTTRPAS